MKTRSIIGFGDVEKHWARLSVAPRLAYEMKEHPWHSRLTVWEVEDADWNKMLADEANPHADEIWADAGWRYSEGGITGADGEYVVNGQTLIGPASAATDRNNHFNSLLEFMCDELGWSSETNITGCSVDLAHANNLSLGELWTKYQPAVPR